MEIKTVESFLEYHNKIRERTRKLVTLIPHDKLDWSYMPGKFSIGDLVRHIAAMERWMYAETVAGRQSAYHGSGKELADGYEALLVYFDTLHQESLHIFRQLSDKDLIKKCSTPARIEITTWKWLRAMIEHEIHHRGQLYLYLSMLGIKTPPIFGLTAEEVQNNSYRQTAVSVQKK